MRNITTLILLGLLALATQAQTYGPAGDYDYCSAVSSFKHQAVAADEIIQTPLLFDYDVRFYHFDLNISRDTTFLSGSVKYLAEVTADVLDTFAVELIDEMVIDSILFNGTPHSYFRENNEVFVPVEQVAGGELFTCQFYYHGTPPSGNFFTGVSKGYNETWDQTVVWTLAEPFNAREWWPAKQVLDDKADSVWVFLTTDASCKAGSIGLLDQVDTLPGNKVRYEWKSRYPIAYYLISYAVADYQEYNLYCKPAALMGDSVLIQNYIYNSPGCLEQYKTGIDNTAPLIELFSDLFSLYPFHEEKYGHCLTELSGGMEHQTMTTIGNFGFGLVAHELGHMWFGDNVTCATWSDIWINESFATYCDYLAHEMIAGSYWSTIWLNQVHDYVISQPDGSVYVPPDEIYYGNENRIFNSRLTYRKGAYMLHMIRYELDDDDLFFSVLQNFQAAFSDSVAGSQDFIDVLNETTGKDFTVFFDQWLYGEGYPIYDIDWTESDGLFELTSVQSASAADITPFFEMGFPVRLYFNDGTDTTIKIEQMQPVTVKTVDLGKGVDSIQIDPDLWVLKMVASINEVGEKDLLPDITISPNPATDKLNLTFNREPGRDLLLEICTLSGEVVRTVRADRAQLQLDVSDLAPGMYFIRSVNGQIHFTSKFIRAD